jgi:hypothetical protein
MSAITFDRAKVLATCKTAKDRREWTELMDLIEAESARAAAAEARAHRLATSLDEANAARHGTIDKLNAAVLARKAAEAECARLRARLEEATGHIDVLCDEIEDTQQYERTERRHAVRCARAFLAAGDS